LCKDYEEYSHLRQLQKQYEVQHAKLLEKIKKDVSEHTLEADSIIKDLFEDAFKLPTNEQLVSKARLRVDIGNPPGKKGSLGDAINWEALLENTPDEEALYFISDDRDYNSVLDEKNFKEFLLMEWTEKKTSNLLYYRRLSLFFNEHFPDINLASELEKELLIQKLASSKSFAQTHNAISNLTKYTDFTASQINEIIEAVISNNQIYWIIKDSDVNRFVNSVVSGHEDQIDEDNLAELRERLEEEDVISIDIPDDEIPF
jgi:hypothetical protein